MLLPGTRIGLVTYSLAGGGQENSLLRLALYFRESGCIVRVITTEGTGEWISRFREVNIDVDCIGLDGAPPSPWHALRVGHYLAKQHFDVVLLSHARFAQAAIRMLPEKVIVIPVVRADDPVMYRVAECNAAAWNAAVGISPKLCAELEARVPGRPIRCIPNGVPIPAVDERRDDRRLTGPLSLVYIGRLSPEKGAMCLPEILDRCIRRHLDVELTIAGDGPLLRPLELAVRRDGLRERCRFLGMVPERQVYQTLLKSHVLLFPSLSEGLGNVVLEAQACGCIPIASRLVGVTDYTVNHGKTGFLVQVGDSDGFVSAISEVARDGRWERMSLEARMHAKARFSVDVMGRAYAALFAEAIEGRFPVQRRRGICPVNLKAFRWYEFIPRSIRVLRRKLLSLVRDWSGV